MARAGKLKVYRTSIGFHDAYVAAPSQKAALDAWGSDKNLFSRGAAEVVTDEQLTAEPLASPGKVVKRLRGTAEQQMAALSPGRVKAATRPRTGSPTKAAKARRAKPSPPPPPPSRTALETAEAALASMQQRGRSAIKELDRRAAELAQERRRMMAALVKEEKQLTSQRDVEADKYSRAIRRQMDH